MLCEKCHQNKATVHLNRIINGEVKEIYLCASCAAAGDLGFSFGGGFGLSFDNLFQGFLDTIAGAQGLHATDAPSVQAHTINKPKNGSVCASCGLTFDSFGKTGKLGCAGCYSAFRSELEQILKNIQGSNIHEGKFPKRAGEAFVRPREIERLKAALKKAIEEEEYEQAAVLRDEIRELAKNEGGQ